VADRTVTVDPGRRGFDLVVVGGGPAGAAAAITAAAAGLSVLVLENSAGQRRRPGETLHPGAGTVFTQLGIAGAVADRGWLRHEGQWVEWDAPARFVPFGGTATEPWRGYQAPRPELDRLLLDRAVAAGAEVRRCTALAPTRSGGRVDGVITETGRVDAGHVIDASGRRHWAARALRHPVHRVTHRLLASWGHLQGPDAAPPGPPLLRADAEGWTWTARVGPETWAWVCLDVTGRGRLRPPPGSARVGSGPFGADVTWRRADVTAAPGLRVVGDAAGVLDPASGSGVLRALVTGAVAGTSVVDVVAGRARENEVAAAYRRWLADWFRADVRRLDQLYRALPAWPAVAGAEAAGLRPRTAAAPAGALRAGPVR
jgi:flavin-dependent dehydrogenase